MKSKLTAQKTIRGFVRFPMSTEEAALYIETALQAEVERRFHVYKDNPVLQKNKLEIAKLFTSPTPKIGIMLWGGVGNGKTSMMKALQNLLNYLEIPIIDNTTFDTYGMRIESAKFICNQAKFDIKDFLKIQRTKMLGIDDLGEEEPVMIDYGNHVTPLIDLLSYRYDSMLFTMVTTNLKPKEIRSTYGDRIADRFNEMMLFVPYENLSFRTPQESTAITEKL